MMRLHEALTKGGHILQAKGVESPQLSCELILAFATKQDRSQLLGAEDRELRPDEEVAFKQLLGRRAGQEPVAYLTEQIEFYSRSFGIKKGVFIPRPETELLVSKGLEIVKDMDCPKVLDLCTGSGCVIISILLELDDGEFWGTDISENAIKVAEYNARKYGLQKDVSFREGNLFQPLRTELVNNFDLIVTNPPYIRSTEIAKLDPQVKDHQPHVSLDGGRDGLNFYRNIIDNATQLLNPSGTILMELDPTLVEPIGQLLDRKRGQFEDPQIIKDLAGMDRVMLLRPKKRGGL